MAEASVKKTLFCNFCKKSQHDVRKLIKGEGEVLFCDECVELCVEIIQEKEADSDPKAVGSRLRYIIKISIDRPFAPAEQNYLPAILSAIESNYPGSAVSIKAFQTQDKGGLLQIYFDSPTAISAPAMTELSAEIEHLVRQLKIAQERLITERAEKERYEVLYKELVEEVFPVMINQLRRQGRLKERSVKTLLIIFADIAGFSKLPSEERANKVDLMRLIGKSILSSEQGLYTNTWGDGLIAAFDDPTQGLRCACKFVQHQRWSHFLRQPVKVDSPIQRTNHHEDAETVFG